MTITVVIPAYNEERYLGGCLESLRRNGSGKFLEIIVVDNGSTDGTAAIAACYPDTRLFFEERRGTNAARERGFREARGDLVACIDADTKIPQGWFEKAEQHFVKDDFLVCLSGPYRYYDGTVFHRAFLSVMWWLSAPLTYRLVGYMALGGNFVARREAIMATGGFNKTKKFYGDDTDIARRLSRRGRVRFHMNFFIYTSCRRFLAEGFIKTAVVYGLNFAWEAIFQRPFTKTHRDIRFVTPPQT